MAAMTDVDATDRREARRLGPALGSAVRQTWWLGLGILATIGEQTARIAGALVEKGREIEPSVVSPVRQAKSSLAEAAQLGRASEALRRVRGPTAWKVAGSPTKEEFEQLAEEVRVLRERLAQKDAGGENQPR